MGAGERRYIQPDICGRATERFYPSARQQNVIIEVINTHPPELETFYALLHYSCFNHIVLFYFVAEGSIASQYSGFKQFGGEAKIWVSHYLLDGKAFRNGNEVKRGADESDEHWHDYLMSSYFGTPLKEKTQKGR